jgi:hypothetical protein
MWYRFGGKNLIPKREKVLGGGLVVLVVGGGNGFQIFGFEHLVAIQASQVVHTIASGQHFSAGMSAGLHRKRERLSPF